MTENQHYNVPPLHPEDLRERDACALICAVRKGGQPTHGNVKRTIEALTRMGHRTGIVDGEGDGVGIMTDIPRQLWSKSLARAGLRSSLASDPNFWVAHLMIPARDRARAESLVDQICRQMAEAGLDVLVDQPGKTNRTVLGRNAEKNEPVFWQIAGLNGTIASDRLESAIFTLQSRLERELGVHFPSFSSRSVVYKVQGTVEILRRYYPELRDPEYASTVTLGHARYSTNTNSNFERVQPFNVLGHNGEFNTISRFRMEAAMLGVRLEPGNSDSQDIDRMVDALSMQFGLDLIEAMEYVFPPYDHDLMQNAPDVHALYDNIRHAFGPFAQGPAALAARAGNQCVFSVDALGLRPLWFGETEKEYFATSERGVYALDSMVTDPKPLAPGEKIALIINPGQPVEVLDYPAIQRHVASRARERGSNSGELYAPIWTLAGQPNFGPGNGFPGGSGNGSAAYASPSPVAVAVAEPAYEESFHPAPANLPWQQSVAAVNTSVMAALGWERYHLTVVESMAESKKELVGSLGWDGPLAAFAQTRVNMADYFKETVAVVTNPAIDRERERAQFSTTVLLGVRPLVGALPHEGDILVELQTPLLLGGHPDLGSADDMRTVADKHGTLTLEDLALSFGDRLAFIPMTAAMDELLDNAVARIGQMAVELARSGIQCIILDDSDALDGSLLWIDPMLAVASVDQACRSGAALRRAPRPARRRVGDRHRRQRRAALRALRRRPGHCPARAAYPAHQRTGHRTPG